jgi:hypothetical protein
LTSIVFILAACNQTPGGSATSPAATLSADAGPAQQVEVTPLPETFSPVEEEPTYISISRFPVAVIEAASAQSPAYVSVEMAGFDISELAWQVGHYEEGCNHLVGVGKILPEAGDTWPDGVHQASFSWPAAGFFLGDGERADFVYLEETGSARMISGRFRKAGGEAVDANLLVDPAASRITGVESTTGTMLSAAAGDSFQLYDRCLEADDSIRPLPGVELFFLEGGQLNFELRPLTTGNYFLRLTAGSADNIASSRADFQVNNDFLVPEHQVYLNTEYGFQFLYPAGWQSPQMQDGRLVTGDGGGTTQTVTIHPDRGGASPADLKNLALSQFGNVTILFEDQVSVDGTGALWTAYGYDGPDGPHTGILLAFVRDGVGYTVDLDGREPAEAQTILLMNTLVENWRFRPDITGPRARDWTAALFDDLAMPVMTTYYQEELSNGWRRYTVGDGVSFLAVRSQSLSRDDLSDVFDHWREVAARGAADFRMSEEYEFLLNGREWLRTDFAYLGEGSLQIQGFVMAAEINNRAVVFWAEMPITRYDEQSAQFLLSLAGLR